MEKLEPLRGKIPADLSRLILSRSKQFDYSDPWAFLEDAVNFRVKGAEESVQHAYAETVLAMESLDNELRLLSVALLELWEVQHRKNETDVKHLKAEVRALIDKISRADI